MADRRGAVAPAPALALRPELDPDACLAAAEAIGCRRLVQAGLAQGMAPEEATKTAGLFFALVMLIALVWAPVLGVLNDRFDRTGIMAASLAVAAVGYSSLGAIPDPLGGWMYPAAVLLGIGQMSVVSASQTLIGQEAPAELRGSVTGMFWNANDELAESFANM